MFNKEDYHYEPNMLELSDYINNPLWDEFNEHMIEKYKVQPIFEFSKCSAEYGWNVKYKKSGKTLCTMYPRENYFTLLVVIGNHEKDKMEELLFTFTDNIKQLYLNTQGCNNQKWLMIDLEDNDSRYEDIKRIIELRIK